MTIDNIFKGTNFTFNSFILKEIYKYNLSLDEFILFIYFFNKNNPVFNIEEISNATGMKKECILNAFNSLIEKKVITLVTNKDNDGIIYEFISLDIFYKSIDENISKTNKTLSIDNLKEYIFNELGIKCSNADEEIINAWINSGFSIQMICDAVSEAKVNGLNSFRYIDKILYEWKDRGITSKEEATSYLKNKSDKSNNNNLFDYDWLDEDN